MENNSFIYNYSAKTNKEIEEIRKRYLPQEESKIDTLRRLDRRARGAGIIESLCIGIIGMLIFGVGMCFFLGVFKASAWITALIMIAGALVMLPAYPIYKRVSRKTKEELTPAILKLSDEISSS